MQRHPRHHQPLPLERYPLLETGDFDEACAVASAAQHPHQAELFGLDHAFRFRLHHCSLPTLRLTCAELDYQSPYRVVAPPLETEYFLQLPLRGRFRVRHGSRRVVDCDRHRGVLLSPSRPSSWEAARGFAEVTLGISRRAVEQRWLQLTGREARGTIEFEPDLPLDSGPTAALARLVHFLVREIDTGGAVESMPSVLAPLEEALLDEMLLSLSHSHRRLLDEATPDGGRRLVREAEAYMAAHAGSRLTIGRVAAAHEVSIRTLQRAFQRHREALPRDVLRRMRFEKVHGLLRDAPDDMTVTSAAVRCGFCHLGQFSVDYRRKYGETPSQTLRRSRDGNRRVSRIR